MTAGLTVRDYRAQQRPVDLLLHGLIYLALAGGLFWAIDRAASIVLALALAGAGALVFTYLV